MFKLGSISQSLVRCGVLVAATFSYLSAQVPAAEEEDIRGPKELLVIPKTWLERLSENQSPVVIGSLIGVGVIVLILGWIGWRRYQAKHKLDRPSKIALLAFSDLEAKRESVTAEIFGSAAALILRQYIGSRFGIAAPHRTTEEFFRHLADYQRPVLVDQSDHLRTFLKSCDLAKFAGADLTYAERAELVAAARTFVRSTSHAAAA